jgi:hypothetical protein
MFITKKKELLELLAFDLSEVIRPYPRQEKGFA